MIYLGTRALVWTCRKRGFVSMIHNPGFNGTGNDPQEYRGLGGTTDFVGIHGNDLYSTRGWDVSPKLNKCPAAVNMQCKARNCFIFSAGNCN